MVCFLIEIVFSIALYLLNLTTLSFSTVTDRLTFKNQKNNGGTIADNILNHNNTIHYSVDKSQTSKHGIKKETIDRNLLTCT